jgi:hypothetical protein
MKPKSARRDNRKMKKAQGFSRQPLLTRRPISSTNCPRLGFGGGNALNLLS